jgi:hypothetical protein
LLKKDTIGLDEGRIETEAFVVIADPDGKNSRTIASEKGTYAINPIPGEIDWR